jgi:hypothetical protein
MRLLVNSLVRSGAVLNQGGGQMAQSSGKGAETRDAHDTDVKVRVCGLCAQNSLFCRGSTCCATNRELDNPFYQSAV